MARSDAAQFERMTQAPVAPLILRLAVPTTLSMLMTSIYNMADTAFVGQLGTSASGAVGIVFAFMSIIQAFGFMFGQGAGSIVARLLGQRRLEDASVTTSTAFFFALGFGVIISALSFAFLDPLIYLLGSTPTIAPYAKTYISFILMATPFMTASFAMNQVLRYEGHANLGMVGMLTGAALNIAGDLLLIFVLDMGIAGAGLSTALSETVSFCILLWMYLSGRATTRISPKLVTFDPAKVFDIVATGFPSLLRQGLQSYTTMLLNLQAAAYGDAAIAAMSIVGRIVFFVFSLALGLGQGFQPVSGFNYGARKYSRVRKAYRSAVVICECLMLGGMVVLLVFSGDLIKVFRDDPEVIAIGTRALRIQAVSLLFVPLALITDMLLQSTGHKLGATILTFLRGGIIFIPTILILAHVRGLAGIQEAQAVAWAVMFPMAMPFIASFFGRLPKEDGAESPKAH